MVEAQTATPKQLPAKAETGSLIPIVDGAVHLTSVPAVQAFSKLAIESGYFAEGDTKNVAQASMKILFGMRMGLDPLESINDLIVQKGQVTALARLHARKIQERPDLGYEVVESTDDVCTLKFFRDGKEKGQITYTMQTAREAGITGKFPWKADPGGMLFNKAITRGYKRYFPDLYKIAVQSKEDMDDGETIEHREQMREHLPSATRERAQEMVRESDITDACEIEAEPTASDQLQAAIELSEELNEPEILAAAQETLENLEKISPSDSIQLVKAATVKFKELGQKDGAAMPWLINLVSSERFGLDRTTWNKDMTKSQMQAVQTIIANLTAEALSAQGI